MPVSDEHARRRHGSTKHMDFDNTLLLTLLIFFLANLIQGYTGFGMGIAAVTGLSLIGDIVQATILVNLVALITVTAVFGRLWRHAHWRYIWPLLLGITITNPIGLGLLKTFGTTHPGTVKRVLGVVIIAFAVWSLSGRSFKIEQMRWYVGLAVGMLGGIAGGAFTMSGPPLVTYVYSLPIKRDELKASINACFIYSSSIRLVQLVVAGDITRGILGTFAWCLPAIVLGVVLGMVLSRGVGTERFRRTAWTAFAMMGLVLIVR